LATTNLRLLLDECVVRPIAEAIKSFRSLKVESVNDTLLANIGFQDEQLVEYARKSNRILVTSEGRLNEKQFPICTHPGIIVIKATQRHDALKSRMFKDLIRSGTRRRCNHAVTYLRLDDTGTRTVATFKERDDTTSAVGTSRIDLTSGKVLSG
jgi:predicted nuclease of predicted toxin-antitoxin system